LAFAAAQSGADYVAFGAFFETPTKTPKARAELEILTWWHEAVEIPSVAIGGITTQNAAEVITAGADFIALSSGVWQHPDGPADALSQLSVW
jgi:thiamine-phosphate pyrophosphorylase